LDCFYFRGHNIPPLVVSGGINPIFENGLKTELIVAYVYSINVSQGKLTPIPKNVKGVAEYP
jgi:hypothetical protein